MTMFPMLKTLLAGLFGKSATLKYPVGDKKTFEATRGRIENDIEACIFCGICQKKCPTGAIIVDRAEKTWSIARYDCMQCGRCAELCPKKCLSMTNAPPDAVTEQKYFTMRPKSALSSEKDA